MSRSEPINFAVEPNLDSRPDSVEAVESITLENLFADSGSEPEGTDTTISSDALTLADLFAEPEVAPEWAGGAAREPGAESMTLADLFGESGAEFAAPERTEPPATLVDLWTEHETGPSANGLENVLDNVLEDEPETVTATDLFTNALDFNLESGSPAEPELVTATDLFADALEFDPKPAIPAESPAALITDEPSAASEPGSESAESLTLTDWFGDAGEPSAATDQPEPPSYPTDASVTDWFADFAEGSAPGSEPSEPSEPLSAHPLLNDSLDSESVEGDAPDLAVAAEAELQGDDQPAASISTASASELLTEVEPVPDLAQRKALVEPAPPVAPATVEPATVESATVEPATVAPATIEPATVAPVRVAPVIVDIAALSATAAAPTEPASEQTVAFTPEAELFTQAAPESNASELDAAILAQLDDLLAEPPPPAPTEADSDQWFLGIDIGTTGISAVLLNRPQCRLYPLYWQSVSPDFPARRQFRLSTAVTLLTDEPKAFPLPTIRIEPTPNATLQTIAHWKPYLKIAVPHYSPQTSRWEPALQWVEQQTLPLRTVQEVLQQLLATLNPERASFLPMLTCGALGLEPEEFQTVLRQLNSVVVGYPSNWPDTYSFNLREAILQAELVQSPTQIVFLEEPIAALLSALPATDRRSIALAQAQGQSGHLHNADWQGVTLILSAGTIVTELVMVNLPAQLQALNSTDFYTRSLPLAGHSLDQDIVGQLLYPALRSLLESNHADREPANIAELSPDLILEQWDSTFDPTHLTLEPNDFPAAAELALAKRHRLQQQFSQNSSGQTLLNLAHALKITLQFQPRFVVQWRTQQLVFDRQMLTSQVLLPYIQRLNRELNTLLAQTNTTAAAVKQVLCTGGTASLATMTRWLRQKLPNATIVQDTYPQPASLAQPWLPSCSRVAYGLAALPLHPQVVDQSRHQFSDYLLLKALLKVMPTQPTRVSTVMQLLEQQGIDTQVCRFRILALLEGHLPPGLIPAEADLPLLAAESAHNPDYQAIRLAPLLLKHADRTYEPNPPVWAYLQQYLDTLLADTEQTLAQPLQPALTPLHQLNQTQNLP